MQERPKGWFIKKANIIVLSEETEYLDELVDNKNFKAVDIEVDRLDPRGKFDEEEEIIKRLNEGHADRTDYIDD